MIHNNTSEWNQWSWKANLCLPLLQLKCSSEKQNQHWFSFLFSWKHIFFFDNQWKKMHSTGLFIFVLWKAVPNVLLVIYLIMRGVCHQGIHCYGIYFCFFTFKLFWNTKEEKISKKQRQELRLVNCKEYVTWRQISHNDFSHGGWGRAWVCTKLYSGQ